MKGIFKKIFSVKEQSGEPNSDSTRILFATDIHGSNTCFKKILNAIDHPRIKADAVIIGGDITGKDLVYIVQDPTNQVYHSTERGENITLNNRELAKAHEKRAADSGSYIYWCEEENYKRLSQSKEAQDQLLKELIEERMKQWVELAEERLKDNPVTFIMNTGNDDFFSIDEIIQNSEKVIFPEGQIIQLKGGLKVLSCGYANLTPFGCPRDISEKDLYHRIESYIVNFLESGGSMDSCILNLHCPPIQSKLDLGPKLVNGNQPKLTAFGKETDSVGSSAVRDVIEKYQPALGLHGHIHESPGTDKIGSTTIINPGSEYQSGILRFALIDFNGLELKKHVLRTAM